MSKIIRDLDIISEFMSPFEDSLTVLFLGDQMDEEFVGDVVNTVNSMRESFVDLPNIKTTKLLPIKHLALKTTELFKGKAEDHIEKDTCIIFMDTDLSKDVINIITNNADDVDELDAMLIEKYLLSAGQEKFVLDVTKCDNDRINTLLSEMDERAGEFNYIIVNNLLGIWIYNNDDFPFI
jgi:hypothetical protein